jgi:hypothetical protein
MDKVGTFTMILTTIAINIYEMHKTPRLGGGLYSVGSHHQSTGRPFSSKQDGLAPAMGTVDKSATPATTVIATTSSCLAIFRSRHEQELVCCLFSPQRFLFGHFYVIRRQQSIRDR